MRMGVDIVCVAQVARALTLSTTFSSRVYSRNELKASEPMTSMRRSEFLAGRFAVKEAVLKILRAGAFGQVSLTDIETTVASDGKPELWLLQSALHHARSLALTRWDVSISHDCGRAIALVAAE
jgi:holo-[acyl-carrier protein] synthase